MKISTSIRQKRLSLGFTQGRLADIIGKDRTTVAKYELGHIMPPADVYQRILALQRSEPDAAATDQAEPLQKDSHDPGLPKGFYASRHP